MIKVFSFIGSMAGEKSATARYSDELAETLRRKAADRGEEVRYERVMGNEIRIGFCRSCNSCFKTGSCPLDPQDDMAVIKQKIKDCDILFFGSPVYLTDMSGIMKTVIDRIAYWTHRYELAGKPAVFFATTDSSFGTETAQHMAELLSYTGLIPVCAGYAARGMNMHPNLYIREDMEPLWEEAADKALDVLRSPASYLTERDEIRFQARKRLAGRGIRLAEVTGIPAWDECYVLQKRGVLDVASYAEYLNGLHTAR